MNSIRFIHFSFVLLVLCSSLLIGTPIGNYTANAASGMTNATLLQNIQQIDAGGAHTCALTNNGGVKCWGNNGFGQLGNGTFATSGRPVDVVGLESGVVAISAGYLHTCALTSLGKVMCWGQNYDGQLGDGSTDVSASPVDVIDLEGKASAISAGFSHTCAVLIDSTVNCWGANHGNQLGNFKTGNNSTTPVQVLNMNQPMNRVIAVTAGVSHTCVLTKSGGVQCWGDNADGQVGTNDTYPTNRPLGVYGLDRDVITIDAGNSHTCALLSSGAVKCWGDNSTSQLGVDTIENSLAPTDVKGIKLKATTLSTGGKHTCVVTNPESVTCWGDNSTGQLGNNSTVNSATPVDVYHSSSDVVAITAGEAHTCILTKAGDVKCWGSNESGQLGNGQIANSASPRVVRGLRRDIVAMSSGTTHTCVVTSTGEAMCWGRNDSGQLGDGSTNNKQTPTSVTGLGIAVVAISAGDAHTCALTDSGGVKCWGRNDFGQLGNGTGIKSSSRPVDVSGLDKDVIAISAGYLHNCALSTNGNVKCWGWNLSGQLGNGRKDMISNIPVDVVGLDHNIIAIASGGVHTCALTDRGEVKCWGSNNYSQLGSSDTSDSRSPVSISGLDEGVSTLSTGGFHTCVVMKRGSVKCWGLNNFGELGNNRANNLSATPVNVEGLNGAVASISSGSFYTCAISTRGGVKCWGKSTTEPQNNENQMDSITPVEVRGLRSGVSLVSAGGNHTCALTNVGAKCWGNNSFGQLGDGKAWHTTPVDVAGF